jgi:hypothetical protein
MNQTYGLTGTVDRDRRIGRPQNSPTAGAEMYRRRSGSYGHLGTVLALTLILAGTASNQAFAGNGGGAGGRSGTAMTPPATPSAPQHLKQYAPVPAPQPAPVSSASGSSPYGQSAGSSFGTTNGGLYPASGYSSGNPAPIYGPPVPTAQPPAQPYPASAGGSGYPQYAGWGYGGTAGSYYPATTYNSANYAPATAATACPMAMYASAPYAGASAAPQAPPLYAPSSYANSCATVPSYPSYPR